MASEHMNTDEQMGGATMFGWKRNKVAEKSARKKFFYLLGLALTSRFSKIAITFTLISLIVALTLKCWYVLADVDGYNGSTRNYLFDLPFIDRYIKELDIAGLLGGILSLIVSLYITVIIEDENSSREADSAKFLEKIEQVVTSIHKRERLFSAHDRVSEMLVAVSGILTTAQKNNQAIHIISHQRIISDVFAYRVHTVLDFCNVDIHDLKAMTYSDYTVKRSEFEMQVHALELDLIKTAKALQASGSQRNVKYTTLNAEFALEDDYVCHIMEQANVIFYDENSNSPIAEFQDVREIKDLDGIYFVPISGDASVINEKDLFIAYLKKRQLQFCAQLRGHRIDVREVEHISVDAYLTEISEGTGDEGSCVFLLANKYTLTNSQRKLLCFEVKKEKYVTDSFIKIIEATK